MKPILTFTDYIEDHEEFVVQITLVAKFEGEVYTAVSPNISQSKATDVVLDKHYRQLLEEVTYDVLSHMRIKGTYEMNPSHMTLLDKFSVFDIKQTVGFNNGIHDARRNPEILMDAIW